MQGSCAGVGRGLWIVAGGSTIVLVEQNARLALLLAKHAYVMEVGRISMSGLAADLKDDHKVRETYLGV